MSLTRKLEALERRMAKMMSKDPSYKERFESAYNYAKAALEKANEGDNQGALDAITRFNSLMNEHKLNRNV